MDIATGPRDVVASANCGTVQPSGPSGRQCGVASLIDESLWRAVCSFRNPARQTNGANAGASSGWGRACTCAGCATSGRCGLVRAAGVEAPYRCTDAQPQAVGSTSPATPGAGCLRRGTVDRAAEPTGEVERLVRRDDSVDLTKLRLEQVEIRERKDELATLFADGTIDAGQFATATKRLTARENTIASTLAAVGWRSPLEPLAGGDFRILVGPDVGTEAGHPGGGGRHRDYAQRQAATSGPDRHQCNRRALAGRLTRYAGTSVSSADSTNQSCLRSSYGAQPRASGHVTRPPSIHLGSRTGFHASNSST